MTYTYSLSLGGVHHTCGAAMSEGSTSTPACGMPDPIMMCMCTSACVYEKQCQL